MLLFHVQAVSQQKYEREVRISADDVHPDALKFLKDSPVNSKVKWYREIGLDTTSIEAKTKYKGQRYSIEFSENGVLEDVEVEIKARDLEPQIIKTIEQTIEQTYGDFKIEKIQLQYTGSPQLLKSVFGATNIPDAVIIKYELVISSKESGTYKRFELLFTEELELERTTEIITKNDINIEY